MSTLRSLTLHDRIQGKIVECKVDDNNLECLAEGKPAFIVHRRWEELVLPYGNREMSLRVLGDIDGGNFSYVDYDGEEVKITEQGLESLIEACYNKTLVEALKDLHSPL